MIPTENRPPALDEIERGTRALGFDMAIDEPTGRLLRSLAASKPVGRLLEFGTGTGASAAWIADGMDDRSWLLSLDNDPRVVDVARSALKDDHRIEFRVQDGGAYLQDGQTRRFDMIFADAMPGKFDHLDEALHLLAPGGIYVVDDLLPQPNWPENHQPKVDAFIDSMLARPRFRTTILDWSTGLLIAVKAG